MKRRANRRDGAEIFRRAEAAGACCAETWFQLSTSLMLMALLLFLGACGDRAPKDVEPPLETVDVEPEVEISVESDVQAQARPPELAGQLPSSFPSDVPLYLPASLIDFGRTNSGRRTVTLLTSHSLSQVSSRLESRLVEAGWTLGESGAKGRRSLRKGERQVTLVVENANPGTSYRFEY